MTSPSISAVETTGPWQGSLSGIGLPANSDDGAVIIASEQAEGATGMLVSYADGQFTSRFRSAAPRFRYSSRSFRGRRSGRRQVILAEHPDGVAPAHGAEPVVT